MTTLLEKLGFSDRVQRDLERATADEIAKSEALDALLGNADEKQIAKATADLYETRKQRAEIEAKFEIRKVAESAKAQRMAEAAQAAADAQRRRDQEDLLIAQAADAVALHEAVRAAATVLARVHARAGEIHQLARHVDADSSALAHEKITRLALYEFGAVGVPGFVPIGGSNPPTVRQHLLDGIASLRVQGVGLLAEGQ